MKQNTKMTLPYICLAILLCILFGSNAVAVKISFNGFGLLSTAALRFSISVLLILLWIIVSRRSFKIEKEYLKKSFVVSLIFSAQVCFMFAGINNTTASRATLLINLQPFFVLILSHLFIAGDRITFRKLLGMIIGFCGLLSMFVFTKNTAADFMAGDVLMITAAMLWACNVIYLKSFIHNASVVILTFYHLLLSLPVFIAGAFIFDDVMFKAVSAQTVCALLYQAFVTAFGFIAWASLIKKFQASLVHSFVFILPVSGVLCGILILNEPFAINIVFALILISIGILITHYSGKANKGIEGDFFR